MKNLTLRIISSFFLIVFFFSLTANKEFIFILSTHFLISLSLWEFLRLTNFQFLKKKLLAKNGFYLTRQRIELFDYFLIIFFNILCFFLIKKFFVLFFIFSLFLIIFLFFQKIKLKKLVGISYIVSSIFFLILINYDQNYKMKQITLIINTL